MDQLNDFTDKLLQIKGSKNVNKASILIRERAHAQKWSCRFSDQAITYFLTKGFCNFDLSESPQGLSVFSLTPVEGVQARSKKARRREIQEILGDKKLSEADLEELSEPAIYIPKSMAEAKDQVSTMISFLKLLTEDKEGRRKKFNVATTGYEWLLSYMENHRHAFNSRCVLDKTFLPRLMYLADRYWQHYLYELIEKSTDRHSPMRRPRKLLSDYHIWFFQRELGSISTGGSTYTLTLPVCLSKMSTPSSTAASKNEPAEKKKKKKASKEKEKDKDKEAETKADSPSWHTTNPSPRDNWLIPEGKKWSDYWGAEKAANGKGFPKVRHHASRRTANLCIAYQVVGKCSKGSSCSLAHVKPDEFKDEESEAISSRLKELYGDEFKDAS